MDPLSCGSPQAAGISELPWKLLSRCDTNHGIWHHFGVSFSSLEQLNTGLGPECVPGLLWLDKVGFSWGSPRGWSHPLSSAEQRGPFMPCPVQEHDWPRIGCRAPPGVREGGPAGPRLLCLGRRAKEKLQPLLEAEGLMGG